jgi:AraC family transcriptional regulator
MECIVARLGENLTLAALAEEVGLSQFHFAHAFKRSTGLSPHRYLMLCRLERAKELLAGSTESVGEIAAQVGFSDPTQLSRLFQAEMATTPSAYRRSAGSA